MSNQIATMVAEKLEKRIATLENNQELLFRHISNKQEYLNSCLSSLIKHESGFSSSSSGFSEPFSSCIPINRPRIRSAPPAPRVMSPPQFDWKYKDYATVSPTPSPTPNPPVDDDDDDDDELSRVLLSLDDIADIFTGLTPTQHNMSTSENVPSGGCLPYTVPLLQEYDNNTTEVYLDTVGEESLITDPGSSNIHQPSPSKFKTAHEVLSLYAKYINEFQIRRVAVALCEYTFFGPDIMKRSTLRGIKGEPLDPLKGLIRNRFLSKTDEEFEVIWRRCEEAIAHRCKKLCH